MGIHQIWHRSCCGNPLFGNFSIRPTVGIHQICHRSCCGNPPIPSSELLWESMRVYNSIRWMYFNNNNYNCSSVGCLPTRYFESRYRYFEARYRYFEARYQKSEVDEKMSCRTSSHPPLSFYIPCSFHLPQDTVLEFWPLEKRRNVKWFELLIQKYLSTSGM